MDKDHATPKSVPTIAADRQLWTILRLSFLHAVWCLHCQRSLDPERHPVTPAIVVAATVAAVKRLMRLDYARTIGDVRTMTASPRHWFCTDTSVPTLAASEFLGLWPVTGHTLLVVAHQRGRSRRPLSRAPVRVVSSCLALTFLL